MREQKNKNDISNITLGVLVVLTLFVWGKILFVHPAQTAAFYFLDVGQGDATLAVLPGGITVLTDAGPDRAVVGSIKKAIGETSYIDLAVISHPQLDHFNGFNYLLDTHRFGAVIINGRDDSGVGEWQALLRKIKDKHIPLIAFAAGDAVRHASDTIDILSPNEQYLQSAELNDTGLVERIRAGSVTALLTADTGENIETYLAGKFDISADILKVGHHGSKYSSSDAFLRAVAPRVAVIEVGAHNTYGHPTPETLLRLTSETPNVFRTDRSGTVKVEAKEGMLKIFTERNAKK